MRYVLVLVTVFTMCVRPRVWAEPLFPSDSKNPARAGGAKLLEAVCPGKVGVGKVFECKIGCPDFTAFGGNGERLLPRDPGDSFPWSLESVTRGHFVSPSSEDAVLSMAGCEPHSENFGGTILLTKRSQRWSMVWYKMGVYTRQCHKVPLRDGREILVCIGNYGGQGLIWRSLYSEDLLNPQSTLMASKSDDDSTFFIAFDNTETCGHNDENEQKLDPLVRADIDEVEFSTSKDDSASRVSVTASFGKKPMNPKAFDACFAWVRRAEARNASLEETVPKVDQLLPKLKTYRMEFMFDGHRYRPTRSSLETVRMFRQGE